MQCSHTALPCVSLQLGPAPPFHDLFRDPSGRSRARANMSPTASPNPRSRRTELLRVRMSPQEHQVINSRADQCGKPVSTFVREVALGSVPRARPGRLEEKAIYHLGRIGNNLNQLAYVANATGRLDDTRRLHEVLDNLLQTIRHLS